MTTEVATGAEPGGPATETGTPAAAQTNAATTNAQPGGAEGGTESQVAPKTYTEEEVRERIERATAKAAAKAERRAFREALARLPQQPQTTSPQPAADDGKPLRSQYATEDEWLDARDAWRDSQRQAKDAQERQSRHVESLSAKTNKVWSEAQKLPGFDSDAFDDMADAGHLTRSMVEALIELDEGPKVLAYMAAHPEEAERISKLAPARQAAEIGKLEAKAAAAPPKTSKAPDPITPIGSGKTPVHDLASAPMDSYIEQRRKQGAVWAR